MGLISRARTNLAPPGAMSPPVDLTGPPVSGEACPFVHDLSGGELLRVNRVVLGAVPATSGLPPINRHPCCLTMKGQKHIPRTGDRSAR
jgi:hypothetical protein